MEWLNQRRLQVACQQLASTSKTITEIAEASGFATPYYFSRVFRQHFGQSPLQYRKTQR
jgi:AraC-like DNA-binding protein